MESYQRLKSAPAASFNANVSPVFCVIQTPSAPEQLESKPDRLCQENSLTSNRVRYQEINEGTGQGVFTSNFATTRNEGLQVGSLAMVCSKMSDITTLSQTYNDLVIECPKQLTESHTTAAKNRHTRTDASLNQFSFYQHRFAPQKSSNRPKLVEIHQYSGYKDSETTSLPNDVSITELLDRVINAQPNLIRQSKYKVYVEDQLLSELSVAILQDVFWWYFLDGWQKNNEIQEKLFNRVAHNYVKLLIQCVHENYSQPFLLEYPDLLSQAVYAVFCEAFVDSYSQFGEKFKQVLIDLVYLWITGFRPSPEKWLTWNYSYLEPAGVWSRKVLLNSSTEKLPDSFKHLSESADLNTLSGEDATHQASLQAVLAEDRKLQTDVKPLVDSEPCCTPTLFNVYGQSPLVVHFLSINNLTRNAGTVLNVKKTELNYLYPLSSTKYQEFLISSTATLNARSKMHEQFHESCRLSKIRFSRDLLDKLRLYKQSEKLLLSHPKQVQQLSEIIISELSNGNASSSKTVKQAIEEALSRHNPQLKIISKQ